MCYIRLTELIPSLLDMVDDGRIGMRPAVELSYLSKESQTELAEIISFMDATPSHDQAIRMRKMSDEGKLTSEAMEAIMNEIKPNQREKISFRADRIRQYLPQNMPKSQTEEARVAFPVRNERNIEASNSGFVIGFDPILAAQNRAKAQHHTMVKALTRAVIGRNRLQQIILQQLLQLFRVSCKYRLLDGDGGARSSGSVQHFLFVYEGDFLIRDRKIAHIVTVVLRIGFRDFQVAGNQKEAEHTVGILLNLWINHTGIDKGRYRLAAEQTVKVFDNLIVSVK